MKTEFLGLCRWTEFDSAAFLYRLPHAYLLMIPDLEREHRGTSISCVVGYVILDGGIGAEATDPVLLQAAKVAKQMAGPDMLDLYFCKEVKRDDYYGHLSPFWQVEEVKIQALARMSDVIGQAREDDYKPWLSPRYNEYEHRYPGNTLNILGNAIKEIIGSEVFLQYHHHLPRITNRHTKQSATKAVESAFMGSLIILRWEEAYHRRSYPIHSWELDAVLCNPWAAAPGGIAYAFHLSTYQTEPRERDPDDFCTRLHDHGKVFDWLVQHPRNPGVICAGKELHALHLIKEHVQRDHSGATLDRQANRLTWTRPGYLSNEPTPDQVQIHIEMIRDLDRVITKLEYRINRGGLTVWGSA